MTSSMLSGDRRWTSGRRGMTVLGKVAVPKPINLPSQRLENHGLDPNVELVPKGSLSWGSKSSSSSNAWGSSTLSPKADGDSSSPSHLSARPSSGGSGTRPSTAGSERGQETANAWCSSSRPSSASGVFSTNQSPNTSLRPRSAETRPGSSHLSRFAEPVIDSAAAWSAGVTAVKLGALSSKNDVFSLASGDFPTLGSEREASGRTTGSQEHSCHSRPGSSSGKAAAGDERIQTSVAGDTSIDATMESVPPNSWRKENFPYGEDRIRPSVERWHTDHQGPHPYPHTGIPPQHYDAWHATVNNNPTGVWYRGPPGGPPYGSPLPRGFPLEPYPPYYRPQLPGNALPNASPVPPAGAGPGGHHPINGDMYRPPIPEGYVHPVMPVRPGFYPGPVGYDSYYGPPMSYCGSNERDVQIMGVAAGTASYNRHLSQNVTDAGGFHARLGGHGPADKLPPEQVQSVHSLEGLRPYKVLLKQHEGWDDKEQHEWDKTAPTSAVVDSQSGSCPWETDRKEEQRKGREMRLKMDAEEASSQRVDLSSGSFMPGKFKSSDGMQNTKGHGDTLVGNAESLPTSPEVGLKGVTLIQKIEGLNAKARASEEQYEGTTTTSRDEQKHIYNPSVAEATAAGLGVLNPDKLPAYSAMIKPTPVEVCPYGDKSDDVMGASGAAVTRKSTHHGRTDKRGSGRLSSQEVDGWQKRKPVLDVPNAISALPAETSLTVAVKENPSSQASELSGVYSQLKDEGQPLAPVVSSNDNQTQRAMLSELAKQRVKQRQKEEEEREKDQKAKALAKLEELNRRTLVENQSQKLGAADVTRGKMEELQTPTEEIKLAANSESSIGVGSIVVQLSSKVHTDTASSGIKEVPEILDRSMMIQNSASDTEAIPINTGQQAHDGSFLKQKRIGYRKKHNAPLAEASVEKTMSSTGMEIHEVHNVAAVDSFVSNDNPSGSDTAISHNSMSDPPGHQRKRTNRSSKYKHQVDEVSTVVLPDGIPKETDPGNTAAEGQQKTPEAAVVSGLVQSLTESKGSESHAQMNNQWKNQHPRKTTRNQQAHRPEKFHSSDSVIWAPVKLNVKADAVEGASQKRVAEVVAGTLKNDVLVQNKIRNRRAEMERYVPKPVAKEMAQQGTCQSAVPANDQTEAIEAVCGEDAQVTECSQLAGSSMVKVGVSRESRSSDGRPNRQGKGHRSWRQRPSADSCAQNLQDVNASETSQNTHRSLELHQDHKPDIYPGKERPKHDQNITLDGWGFPENPDSAVAQLASVARDQRSIVRGKRHVFKGNKVSAIYDSDVRKTNSEGVKNMEESVSEMSQETVLSAFKENRSFGDRLTSQWQPKLSNQWDGIEMESDRLNKKVSPHGKRSLASRVEKEAGEPVGQHLKGQFIGEKNSVEDAIAQAYQDPRKEDGKSTLEKGCPHSPSRDLTVEHSSTNMDNRPEQRSSSGFRKHGNQSSRLGRVHESHADWGSSGPAMKQTSNWEKQRPNLHYEYQPVGPQNSSNQHIQEGQNSGPKFRERGPNQSRHGRGNFYGRQGGGVCTEVVKTGAGGS